MSKDVPFDIRQTKEFRVALDEILQPLKGEGESDHRRSRSRSISIMKIQEAIMWLGMDLKEQNEEGAVGASNPYPQSYNPDSPDIEPTADGLKL